MTRPLFEGGRPPAAAHQDSPGAPTPVATVRAVRTFDAEQARQAAPPRPLFEPAITAALPEAFVTEAARLAPPLVDPLQQRTAYRLLQGLREASDETLLQFGAQPAHDIDGLLRQATAMLCHPSLARTGQLTRDILAHLPWRAAGWRPWRTRPLRPAPAQLARWSEALQVQLDELAMLQEQLLAEATRVMALIEQHAESWAALHAHRAACRLALSLLPGLADARHDRLARRAQLLEALCASAALTREQLHQLREHFLGVAERVLTLRLTTLPLWRQHGLALQRPHPPHAGTGAHLADTDQPLVDQLGQLAKLVSHHDPLPTPIRPGH